MKLRAKNKCVVGLTGSILSGKSTALALFAHYGALTISADELVRNLYQTKPVQRWLVQTVGTAEPAQVSARIFREPSLRQKVEAYLHPKVLALAARQVKASPSSLIVFEVPLLFEAGWEKYTDLNLVLLGNPKMLSARLKSRRMTRQEYEKRLAAQLPEAAKARRADVVLAHRGTKKDLGNKIKRLTQALTFIMEQSKE